MEIVLIILFIILLILILKHREMFIVNPKFLERRNLQIKIKDMKNLEVLSVSNKVNCILKKRPFIKKQIYKGFFKIC